MFARFWGKGVHATHFLLQWQLSDISTVHNGFVRIGQIGYSNQSKSLPCNTIRRETSGG
jgi:hypothetical protein